MLFQEVIVIESDAQELGAGHPLAKIGNHRILNGSITQIPSRIGRYQCDSRTWFLQFRAFP